MDNNKVEKFLEKEKNQVAKINWENKMIEYDDAIVQHRRINKITGEEEVVRAILLTKLVNSLGYEKDKDEIIEKQLFNLASQEKGQGKKV